MLPTPPNTAVTVEPPSGRDVVVKLAVPSAVNGSVASTVPPCSKLTVPPVTGVVRVLTAAVNVTGCPGWLGLPELLNRVVVSDCWAVSVTDVPESVTEKGMLPPSSSRPLTTFWKTPTTIGAEAIVNESPAWYS